jgi:3-oxoadipate enol-lactonase
MHAFINGHHLHYVDEGPRDAPAVVFVHGFPLDLELWRGQLQACTTSFRTVAYDVMGHGSSDVGDGQYSIEGHVNDLAGIMDHLGIAQAAVAGLSMGGYITLRALERMPQRILAAVLCDTRSGADSTEGKVKRFAGMEQVKKEGSRAFADGFVRALFAPGSFQRVPAAVERIRSVISHTSPLSIAGTLLALAARTDTTPSLASVKVPTLIVVGAEDTLTPPSESEVMHRLIPGSILTILPDAGHLSNLENERGFNEALLPFLRRALLDKRA